MQKEGFTGIRWTEYEALTGLLIKIKKPGFKPGFLKSRTELANLAAAGFNFDLHARDQIHGHLLVHFAHLQFVATIRTL